MISLIFCLWFNGMSPSHALINWYYFCASSLMFWWTLWGMWTRMPSLSSALDFFRSALLPNVENWASGHGVCFFCWSSKGIFLSTLPVVAVLGSLSTVNSGSIYQERSLKTFLLLPTYMCSREKHQHLYFRFCLCDLWFGLCLGEVFSVLDLFAWFALCRLIDRLVASPCYLGLSYFGGWMLSFGCLPLKALESEFFILFVF